MLPGGGWTLAASCVLLVLVAAKAHGRQVRLERERFGVLEVDFRKDNGPVVETLWRHDRIRFWVGVAVFGGPLLAVTVAAPEWGPLGHWPLAGALAIAATLAFACGFIAAGLTAWAGQVRPQATDPAWLEHANWVSLGWWTLVTAALALVWFAAN